jgi:hypothetical protein
MLESRCASESLLGYGEKICSGWREAAVLELYARKDRVVVVSIRAPDRVLRFPEHDIPCSLVGKVQSLAEAVTEAFRRSA